MLPFSQARRHRPMYSSVVVSVNAIFLRGQYISRLCIYHRQCHVVRIFNIHSMIIISNSTVRGCSALKRQSADNARGITRGLEKFPARLPRFQSLPVMSSWSAVITYAICSSLCSQPHCLCVYCHSLSVVVQNSLPFFEKVTSN